MVAGEGLVEFASDAVELVQSCPGDSGEVVVFVMQAHVVGEEVEGAVVGVGFRWGKGVERVGLLLVVLLLLDRLGTVVDAGEEVVLCDEVAGTGVERAG